MRNTYLISLKDNKQSFIAIIKLNKSLDGCEDGGVVGEMIVFQNNTYYSGMYIPLSSVYNYIKISPTYWYFWRRKIIIQSLIYEKKLKIIKFTYNHE